MLIYILCTCARFWGLEIWRVKPWGKIDVDDVSYLNFLTLTNCRCISQLIELSLHPACHPDSHKDSSKTHNKNMGFPRRIKNGMENILYFFLEELPAWHQFTNFWCPKYLSIFFLLPPKLQQCHLRSSGRTRFSIPPLKCSRHPYFSMFL